MMKSVNRLLLGLTSLMVLGLFNMEANAAPSVVWNSPPDGSTEPVGTAVKPMGQAGGTVIGGASDIMLVLDSSGSMGINETVGAVTQSRGDWQKEIAIGLVNSLPASPTVRVGVVEFDSDANVVRTLSPLSSDLAAVIAAINSVDESGGTDIPDGQTAAFNELSTNGSLLDPSVQSSMVVFSDGSSSGDPDSTADLHAAGGVDLIASIALPGAIVSTMQGIVNGPDDSFGNADDYGAFIDGTASIQDILDAINDGGFVGIDTVDVTMPDGTVYTDVAVDAFGNFMAPVPFNINAGANTWTALATDNQGDTATATVTVFGGEGETPAPATLFLFGAALLALAHRRRLSA